MISKGKIFLKKPRSRKCFGCGVENPIGLKLRFYCEGDIVKSDVTLGDLYEGWGNMAHGGIISTLLDETMSWAVMYFKRVLFVTRRMELKYIRPVLVGTPLCVNARIVSEGRGPLINVRGEVRDAKGGLLVRGSGEFAALSPDKLIDIPQEEKVEMLALFNEF